MKMFVLLVALLSAGATLAADPQAEAKARDKIAIEYCDKQVKDELMPVDQRLFIRNTCDRMRADYTAKYGRAP